MAENIKERVLALVEEGFSASQAAERYGVLPRTAQMWVKRYRETGETGRRRGSGRRRITSPEEDQRLFAEAERMPFRTNRQLRQAAGFRGSRSTAARRLGEVHLHARRAAKKEFLRDDHIQQRLAFAEENLNRDWTHDVFSDECIFSSTNDGQVVVYRPVGKRHDPKYVFHKRRCGRVSVSAWGWMSSERLGYLHHIEGRLRG